MDQYSPEWWGARRGMLTASIFRRVTNGTDKGLKSLAQDIKACLAGGEIKRFSSTPTDWGLKHEPEAYAMFELSPMSPGIGRTGFHIHPNYFQFGASPDFLSEDGGVGEVKCPWNPVVHERTLTEGMPKGHVPQVQGEMWITGCSHCWFISFDPRLLSRRADDALYVQKVLRDDEYIKHMERKLVSFWDTWIINENSEECSLEEYLK